MGRLTLFALAAAGSTVSRPSPTPHRAGRTGALLLGLALTVFSATPVLAEVRLDPGNPLANFSREGAQAFTPTPTLLFLQDQSVADVVSFYGDDPDAAPGIALDLFAAFQIKTTTLSNAETGVRLTISDGQANAVMAACIVINGVKGIGLASGVNFSDPANYPVFVEADWTSPTTVRIRRNAAGDAEIMEVNGAAPNPPARILHASLPPRTRVNPTVEFGAGGVEAQAEVDFTRFFTQKALPPQVIVPVDGGTATLTPVTINASAGDQNDPHISGEWVSYASNLSIRYYSFATGIDAQIPVGSSARDLLSDVSGSQVVFSRIITGVKTAVMVFDAATEAEPIEIDPAPGVTRLGSAIGGNTVAYIDSGLEGSGELVIHDLTTSTSRRITFDTRPDQNPQVSPSGNVVTWEHCLSSLSNCDIWQAVKNGPVWDVGVVSISANPEGNPDTNGTLVVYDSLRNGNADIFWKPAAGGAEVQLQMPGVEANPSIAGDFISFESRPTLFSTSDIFVYDRVRNRLFQVTDTADATEQLNDITVLADGRIRVVWASDEDGYNQRNVKAATLELPDEAPTLIADLIALVKSFNLKQGIENSFDAKLQNVLAALDAADAGDTTTACHKLDSFLNEVQAQTGKAITAAQANELITATNQVRAVLACP